MDKTPRPVAHGSSGSRIIVGKKERGRVDRPIRLLSAASNVAIGAGREIQLIRQLPVRQRPDTAI
jgi:hypothetical protein